MRRARLGFLLSLLMVGALLVPAGLVTATRPVPVDATFAIGPSTGVTLRFAGDNLIITQTTTGTFTGDLEGTLVYDIRIVLHLSTGRGNLHLRGTFTGEVNGMSGTMVMSAQATIDSGAQQGTWVLGRGTQDLAGVRGQGTFEGPLGGPLTISGWIHTDP